MNVAPKKANWDLRRDIADKLARLERRTQVRRVLRFRLFQFVMHGVCIHGFGWDASRATPDALAVQAAMINLMQAERGEEGDANNKP